MTIHERIVSKQERARLTDLYVAEAVSNALEEAAEEARSRADAAKDDVREARESLGEAVAAGVDVNDFLLKEFEDALYEMRREFQDASCAADDVYESGRSAGLSQAEAERTASMEARAVLFVKGGASDALFRLMGSVMGKAADWMAAESRRLETEEESTGDCWKTPKRTKGMAVAREEAKRHGYGELEASAFYDGARTRLSGYGRAERKCAVALAGYDWMDALMYEGEEEE